MNVSNGPIPQHTLRSKPQAKPSKPILGSSTTETVQSEAILDQAQIDFASTQASPGCPKPGENASAAQAMADALVDSLKDGCPIESPKGLDTKSKQLLKQTESVALKSATKGMTGPTAAGIEHHQAKKSNGGCPYLGRMFSQATASPATQKVGALEFATGVVKHHKDPVKFFENFHDKHGESFQVKIPGRKLIFDHRPQVMRKAMSKTDSTRGDSSFKKPELQGHGLSFFLGKDNVFLAGGETWKSVQEVMAPHFSPKTMTSDDFMGKMGKTVDSHISRLKERVGEGIEIDIKDEMQKATLDVAMQSLLGTQLSPDELQQTQDSFQVVMENLPTETLNPTNISTSHLPWKGKLKGAYKQLDGLAEKVISENKRNPQDNVVGSLLEAGFPHERVKNEVLTLILAGHETTATLLTWTFAELGRDQVLQERLRQETEPVREGSAAELKSAKLLNATVKETLRLYSPAYFLVRESMEEQTLETEQGPLSLDKGDQLVMSSYNMHRDQNEWGEKAQSFDPERFLDKSKKGFMAPFGGGSRVCMGHIMARNEAALILTRFLQNFEWSGKGEIGMRSDISVYPENSELTIKPKGAKGQDWIFAA